MEIKKAIRFTVNENGGMAGGTRDIYIFGNIDDLDLSNDIIRVKTVCNNDAYINLKYVSMIDQIDVAERIGDCTHSSRFYSLYKKSIKDFEKWVNGTYYGDFKEIEW